MESVDTMIIIGRDVDRLYRRAMCIDSCISLEIMYEATAGRIGRLHGHVITLIPVKAPKIGENVNNPLPEIFLEVLIRGFLYNALDMIWISMKFDININAPMIIMRILRIFIIYIREIYGM